MTRDTIGAVRATSTVHARDEASAAHLSDPIPGPNGTDYRQAVANRLRALRPLPGPDDSDAGLPSAEPDSELEDDSELRPLVVLHAEAVTAADADIEPQAEQPAGPAVAPPPDTRSLPTEAPGPTPPRPRSPTARHWSRPHWQDVADAAAGVAQPGRRPDPDAPRPWEDPVPRIAVRRAAPPAHDLRPDLASQSVGPACRYLGLAQDRSTHFTFADAAHQCFALARPTSIDAEFQKSHCLPGLASQCTRFIAAEQLAAGPTTGGIPPAAVTRRPLVGSPAGAARPVRLLLAILVVIGIVVAAAGILGGLPGPLLRAGVLQSSESPAASAQDAVSATTAPTSTPQPSIQSVAPALTPPPTPPATPRSATPSASAPSVTPTPTPTANPTPAATPVPTEPPAATARPSATPRPTSTRAPRYYVVRPGDTLSAIAARFGTTVAALMALNGLADPSFIRTGQQLRIS